MHLPPWNLFKLGREPRIDSEDQMFQDCLKDKSVYEK